MVTYHEVLDEMIADVNAEYAGLITDEALNGDTLRTKFKQYKLSRQRDRYIEVLQHAKSLYMIWDQFDENDTTIYQDVYA